MGYGEGSSLIGGFVSYGNMPVSDSTVVVKRDQEGMVVSMAPEAAGRHALVSNEQLTVEAVRQRLASERGEI